MLLVNAPFSINTESLKQIPADIKIISIAQCFLFLKGKKRVEVMNMNANCTIFHLHNASDIFQYW